jgi:hypothetical protein
MLEYTPSVGSEGVGRAEPRTSVLVWVGAVPSIAVGLAGEGMASALSLLTGVAVLALPSLVALRGKRDRVLPVVFGLLFVAVVALLPFNSLAFVVDTWTALLMALAALPSPSAPKSRPPVLEVRPVFARVERTDTPGERFRLE